MWKSISIPPSLRSYRLKSKRPLKQLMQKSDDCGWSSAGISDVAYVKDLQTDTIVSHNFSCSKFGYGHFPATGFGWVCASIFLCMRWTFPHLLLFKINCKPTMRNVQLTFIWLSSQRWFYKNSATNLLRFVCNFAFRCIFNKSVIVSNLVIA